MLRLKDLREDNELTQAQCAKIGYIAKNSYIRYEKEERIIPLDTLIYYAKYYNTSLDYIAGLEKIVCFYFSTFDKILQNLETLFVRP